MSAFVLSTLVIFIAELGDKSQLVALWFATRYKWWTVLGGVAAATLVVHLGSVAAGRVLDDVLPETLLRVIVGLSFLGFAWWSIKGDSLDEDDQRVRFGWAGAFGIVTISFFLSELGDKTQLATVSLASREASFTGVWVGSTFGMVAADAIAVAIGLVAGKRLPQRTVGIGAAILFVIFGLLTIGSAFV